MYKLKSPSHKIVTINKHESCCMQIHVCASIVISVPYGNSPTEAKIFHGNQLIDFAQQLSRKFMQAKIKFI